MILISLIIAFLMLNLNMPSGQFCDFGTSFLDASQCCFQVGLDTSLLLTHRVKNINEIDFGGRPLSVDMIRSKCGSVLLFSLEGFALWSQWPWWS